MALRKQNRRILAAITAIAALSLGLRGAMSAPRSSSQTKPLSRSELCPLRSPEEWQLFLEKYASRPEWVQTCENGFCGERSRELIEDQVQAVFSRCAYYIAQNPDIARCTANYRRFVPAWLQQHSADNYGFTINNQEYLARQEAADKPKGMMRVPEAIIRALPSREKVEEACRKNGLPYLTHDSALAGVRTFVLNVDPRGHYDQWMLLNLPDAKGEVESAQPMSVLVVQKKDIAGNPLSRVQLHFRDYNLERQQDHFVVKLHADGDGKCFSCHANGVRQLIARHTPVLDAKPVRGEVGYDDPIRSPAGFASQRLMQFNRRLRSYGAPDWNGMIQPENHGPALGAAQGCTDCHDGRSRAILTVSMAPVQLEQKVVRELGMPYDTSLPRFLERLQMRDPALSEDEVDMMDKAYETHKALLEKFLSSRTPLLRQWLLETPCHF